MVKALNVVKVGVSLSIRARLAHTRELSTDYVLGS